MTAVIDAPGVRAEPVQRRGIEKRLLILRTAKAIIERDGRDAFQIGEVSREAGISVGVLYRYFDSKLTLLEVLYPNKVEGLGESIDLGDGAPRSQCIGTLVSYPGYGQVFEHPRAVEVCPVCGPLGDALGAESTQ